MKGRKALKRIKNRYGGKIVEKVKSIKSNIVGNLTIYSEHSIYKLSEAEMEEAGVDKKYLLNRTFSDYAINHMDHMNLIEQAKRDSEHAYDVAFANTVEEAELIYKNAILICVINNIQNKIKLVKQITDQIADFFAEDIEFT